MPDGRLLIALSDGPLVADPTWTRLDDTDGLVAGLDLTSGRQTLLAQTDTGTGTAYLNDQAGLFDMGGIYYDIVGRQILFQLYDPVADAWEPQFRGWVDDVTYDIDGSAVDAAGDPINAWIQLECVDVFDLLNGYGLTPGLDGMSVEGGTRGTTPAGSEDTIYYYGTSGTVDDRIIEVLANVGIAPTRSIVASGNVRLLAAQYDPGESALTVIRDAADADIPFIANCYVNRSGQFCFAAATAASTRTWLLPSRVPTGTSRGGLSGTVPRSWRTRRGRRCGSCPISVPGRRS